MKQGGEEGKIGDYSARRPEHDTAQRNKDSDDVYSLHARCKAGAPLFISKKKKKGRKREGNHRFPCAAKKTCARVLLMSPNMHQGNRGTVLTSLLQTGVRRVNNRVSIG